MCPDFMRREEHGAVLRWALVKTGPGGKDAKDQSAPLALAVRRGRPPACFCLLFARAKRRSPSGETWPFLLAHIKEMVFGASFSKGEALGFCLLSVRTESRTPEAMEWPHKIYVDKNVKYAILKL